MSRPDYLGEFETLVLLAILQLKDNAYGIEILRVLNEDAGRDVSFGAVYSSLRRMQKKGFVESELGDSAPVRGGPTGSAGAWLNYIAGVPKKGFSQPRLSGASGSTMSQHPTCAQPPRQRTRMILSAGILRSHCWLSVDGRSPALPDRRKAGRTGSKGGGSLQP